MGRFGLGGFEQRVLLAVHQLHGRGYSVSIRGHLADLTGNPVNLGAVYATLDRLEKKGLIASRLGDATSERGGRAKRMYRVEAPGVIALTAARETESRLWADLPPLGEPA